MKLIIGLVGAKASGKTTAFKYILNNYQSVIELTLANKLKNSCSQVFEIPRDYFDSHSFKEKDLDTPVYLTKTNIRQIFDFFAVNQPNSEFYDKYVRPHMGKILFSPRQVAQYIGTEILRAYDSNIHCKSCLEHLTNGLIGVVTDIRFPDELAFFSNNFNNFIPIYIKNTKAEVKASVDTHVSESYLKQLASSCLHTTEDGSIEQLHQSLKTILQPIITKTFFEEKI